MSWLYHTNSLGPRVNRRLHRRTLPRCIRTRTEVDRAALLAQRTDPAIAAALPALGLRVVQSETFYVESNLGDQA